MTGWIRTPRGASFGARDLFPPSLSRRSLITLGPPSFSTLPNRRFPFPPPFVPFFFPMYKRTPFPSSFSNGNKRISGSFRSPLCCPFSFPFQDGQQYFFSRALSSANQCLPPPLRAPSSFFCGFYGVTPPPPFLTSALIIGVVKTMLCLF